MTQTALFAPECDIVQEDAFTYLEKLPMESVDLIITDPPYESLEKHRNTGTTARLDSFWFPVIKNKTFPLFFELCYAVLKPNTHFYMLCDDETSDIAIEAAKNYGFHCWKRIVWDKGRMGMGYHYRNQHEFILFFEKGKRNLRRHNVGSILRYPALRRRHADPAYYPTEKPVELLELLIDQSSEPGDLVLDPFAGSGSTLVAAKQQGRRFWGCDIQAESIALARQRLASLD